MGRRYIYNLGSCKIRSYIEVLEAIHKALEAVY